VIDGQSLTLQGTVQFNQTRFQYNKIKPAGGGVVVLYVPHHFEIPREKHKSLKQINFETSRGSQSTKEYVVVDAGTTQTRAEIDRFTVPERKCTHGRSWSMVICITNQSISLN
jgi:hypothetical protein